MKEDILNKSVSDIRLRSLQKCINKTDSLIFNRDNSIVHIKKTNSTNPFNNANLGVNFSCNKYGNLETYVDNSGTSVAVSANDIKGSNKEIKKVCNNIYDEIFVDKRMHTNDRRGVRFGSVDCININSNNIYSNTRKNVTFNTKIYDDQDYFYNMIHPDILPSDESSVNANVVMNGIDSVDSNCIAFNDKDILTDYLYNKNKDHFFAGTEITTDDTNKTLMRCNPYKLSKESTTDTTSFKIYEKNKPLTFNYGPTVTSLPSTDRHMCYGVYANIFNANIPDSPFVKNHSRSSGGYNVGQYDDGNFWRWHNDNHSNIINMNNIDPNNILNSFNASNISTFIKKYFNEHNKLFCSYGIYSTKRIINLHSNYRYFKNGDDTKYSVLIKSIEYSETKHVRCGVYRESWREHSSGYDSYGSWYDYDGGWKCADYDYSSSDVYKMLFPFGIYIAHAIKPDISPFTNDLIYINSSFSKLKKMNAMTYLNIDDENLNDIRFISTRVVPDATVDGHTYKIEPSISVMD